MTQISFNRLMLYWRTIRTLKLRQITNRLSRTLLPPKFDSRPFDGAIRSPGGTWVQPAKRLPSQIDAASFRFLSVVGNLDDAGWDDPDFDKLWRYNLHYFEDLCADKADERRAWHSALVERWITENPPTKGTGWEPYPTSLRIVNWIKAALSGFELSVQARTSLAMQARWLSQNLEYHLLGNHLFANAKAMMFAGLYFSGNEADRWLQIGISILRDELDEQILADGAQFELSPMYHALAIDDVLDLYNVVTCLGDGANADISALAARLKTKYPKMRRWLAAMSHADGSLTHFNDCAEDIAPKAKDLDAYAVRLDFVAPAVDFGTVTHLTESGYVRLESESALVIVDVGEVGPSYQPGHVHADTLSFELSCYGQRILVNSGTSVYGISDERLRQRATAAHNSVTVDGQNSSEIWSGFRVARRAKPLGLQIAANPYPNVQCAHDGFLRLKNGPLHARSLAVQDNGMTITDQLKDGSGQGVAHFHFHPDCRVTISDDHSNGTITGPDGRKLTWSTQGQPAALEAASYHPRFGESIATTKLVVPLVNGDATMAINW
jgi:uncharacterized heparinase superfamily protein